MPFGVELPENLGQTTESPERDTAPVESPEGSPKELPKVSEPEATKESILDLDKLERFRFDGREWSRKELQDAYLMRKDYSQKTAELAEARKYADNFESDLGKVLQDPKLLTRMKEVYPSSYVQLAERYLAAQNPAASAQVPQQGVGESNKAYEERIAMLEGRFRDWDKRNFEAEVKSKESWLENQYSRLGTKYPHANKDSVILRASVLADQGRDIDESVLEKLYKASNDETKTRWDELYKSKVDQQKKVSLQGKDTGTGGGVPGQAPRGHKTIKEARDAWLSTLETK
jgi:oligoendopeptidase F